MEQMSRKTCGWHVRPASGEKERGKMEMYGGETKRHNFAHARIFLLLMPTFTSERFKDVKQPFRGEGFLTRDEERPFELPLRSGRLPPRALASPRAV